MGSFIETWMDRENVIDWSESEREKQTSYINTYMWVEVIYTFSSAERQWKAALQVQLVVMEKRGQPGGKHGFLTSSPASMSRTARSKRGGPLNTIEQLGSQLWLSKDILEKRKKRRILWLCRQKQTSKFNNYNGKRHFTLGAGGQVGLTVYQELNPLGALAYFPWSERLPGWKLIREAC